MHLTSVTSVPSAAPAAPLAPPGAVGTGANGVEEGHQQHQQRGAPASEGKAGANPRELTDEERTEVRKLQKQDQEVRTHEQAHVAAGGQHVSGGPSYEYETGPDGKRYASGGEVQIDTSPVKGDPQATIAKMQTVRKAALAPAQPSPQDRSVAAKASQQERKARTQLREEQQHQGSSATNKSRPRSEKPTYGPQGSIQPAAPGTVQAPGGALNLIA